jgi:hypothetical protein
MNFWWGDEACDNLSADYRTGRSGCGCPRRIAWLENMILVTGGTGYI